MLRTIPARRWREKLGLGAGAKEMPKIANDSRPPRTEVNAESKPERQRAPQPVARPAPMAPRPQQAARQQARQNAAAAGGGGALAERLKAQREAAGNSLRSECSRRGSASGEAREQRPSDKPKFTFAEEEIAQARREAPQESKRNISRFFSQSRERATVDQRREHRVPPPIRRLSFRLVRRLEANGRLRRCPPMAGPHQVPISRRAMQGRPSHHRATGRSIPRPAVLLQRQQRPAGFGPPATAMPITPKAGEHPRGRVAPRGYDSYRRRRLRRT